MKEASQVSRAAEQLDEMLSAWRERALSSYRYIVLDAQYEKVRQNGQVLDAAVLIACGVGSDGHRDIQGCSVSLSEAEVHWRAFLSSLKDRGLHGIQLIVSDAHEGLRAARKAVFPSVPWHRRAKARAIFICSRTLGSTCRVRRCEVKWQQISERYSKRRIWAKRTICWKNWLRNTRRKRQSSLLELKKIFLKGFTVFSLARSLRRGIRTTNLVERLNEENRRRTRVARLFPNEASCLQLVSAVLMEIAEDWQTADKRYLAFED